jgi:hypothetical protein
MLEMKPNCEYCDIDLSAKSQHAMICSYECTFCANCVEDILHNVCPNCGGGFTQRPSRPGEARRSGVSLKHQPVSVKRVHTRYSLEEITAFAETIQDIAPRER